MKYNFDQLSIARHHLREAVEKYAIALFHPRPDYYIDLADNHFREAAKVLELVLVPEAKVKELLDQDTFYEAFDRVLDMNTGLQELAAAAAKRMQEILEQGDERICVEAEGWKMNGISPERFAYLGLAQSLANQGRRDLTADEKADIAAINAPNDLLADLPFIEVKDEAV